MNTRLLKVLTAGCISGLLLTGCGQTFPEMTQEEYDQIVQYSVSLLMKYSNNGVERLSSLSALEMQRQIEKEAREAAKAERDAQTAAAIAGETQPEEEPVDVAAETGDSSPDAAEPESTLPDASSEDDIDKLLDEYGDALDEGIKNAEGEEETDTTETDLAQAQPEENEAEEPQTEEPSLEDQLDELSAEDTSAESSAGESSSEEEPSEALTTETDIEVDGMRQELTKGLFLTYSGYSVAGSYADENDVFSITATSGNKLLVLNFKLINTSGMDVSIDMVKANPHFQVLLNGTNVGYTNVTMLDNDLSSFAGTIPAGEKVNMVLIKQMKADKMKTVDTLGLIGTLGDDTITFNLE